MSSATVFPGESRPFSIPRRRAKQVKSGTPAPWQNRDLSSTRVPLEDPSKPDRETHIPQSPPRLEQTAHLLTAEQEKELAARIQIGDGAAREALILANLRLVLNIARNYKCAGMTTDDLIQEGNRGLMRAAEDFDPEGHQVRFSSYATFWIRNSIQRAIARNVSLIKVPTYMYVLRSRFQRVMNELRSAQGLEARGGPATPSPDEIATKLQIPRNRLKNLDRAMIERIRFCPTGANGGLTSPEELIADSRRPEHDLDVMESVQAVHAAQDRLTPFESWVIRCRYGLLEPTDEATSSNPVTDASLSARQESERGPSRKYGSTPGRKRTYSQVSRACGLSIHRIRRVEWTALEKMRTHLGPKFNDAI
jgi:RNA polymerase primary sigma factor